MGELPTLKTSLFLFRVHFHCVLYEFRYCIPCVIKIHTRTAYVDSRNTVVGRPRQQWLSEVNSLVYAKYSNYPYDGSYHQNGLIFQKAQNRELQGLHPSAEAQFNLLPSRRRMAFENFCSKPSTLDSVSRRFCHLYLKPPPTLLLVGMALFHTYFGANAWVHRLAPLLEHYRSFFIQVRLLCVIIYELSDCVDVVTTLKKWDRYEMTTMPRYRMCCYFLCRRYVRRLCNI